MGNRTEAISKSKLNIKQYPAPTYWRRVRFFVWAGIRFIFVEICHADACGSISQ